MAEDAQPLVLSLDVFHWCQLVVDLEHFEGIQVKVSTAGSKQALYLVFRSQHGILLLDFFNLQAKNCFGVNNRNVDKQNVFLGNPGPLTQTSFMALSKLDRPDDCELSDLLDILVELFSVIC